MTKLQDALAYTHLFPLYAHILFVLKIDQTIT